LTICLVYYRKYVLMDIGKGSIIRSICRSIEILLFFMISVVGFSVLGKTSLNTKSKIKTRGTVAIRGLSIPQDSHTQHYGIERMHGFYSSKHHKASSSFTLHAGITPLPDILHHQDISIKDRGNNQKSNILSIAFPPQKPYNLFQQNPVLLI